MFLDDSSIRYLVFSCHWRILVVLFEEIHTSKAVVGVVVGVASLEKAMIYPNASKIRNLIGRNYPCCVAAVFSLRFLLFSFIKNYWLAIPVQLFHSIGYGLFWVATVEYTNEVIPSSISATVCNIVVQLCNCFGNAITNIRKGTLY